MAIITFHDIERNEMIKNCIEQGNIVLGAIGYTEHAFAHASRTAITASRIIRAFNYDDRTEELSRIAGFIHDIGNAINREQHAQTGAILAFQILNGLGMPSNEIVEIISAIGNHDENSGSAFSPISAALILADKSDVRRSRVRTLDSTDFDIHDRVNYAVQKSSLDINIEKKNIILRITLDTTLSTVIDYFEIFLTRMIMSRRAASFFDASFSLVVNDTNLM